MPGVSPVTELPTDRGKPLETGIAICLSGGGYRAMLFHLGALWRLAEFGFLSSQYHSAKFPDGTQSTLGTLKRVSSVSGGSITAGVLALRWKELRVDAPGLMDRFKTLVVEPIRRMAEVTLAGRDTAGALKLVWNILLPGSVNDHIAKAYAKHLYGDATLANIPETPRFVINASNLQSGALWRFMAPYIRDWRVGEIKNTQLVSLARAVAASSAFPPFLAPATFEFKDNDYTPNSGGQGEDNLQRSPFTTAPTLADGGVYDNLGLETAYKRFQTLFVSNGGAPFTLKGKVSHDWARLGARVIDVVDNQVRSLRTRVLVDALTRKERYGSYWDIDQDIAVHEAPKALPCPFQYTRQLASIDTDLAKKTSVTQERLINWGYAICDAAIRAWLNPTLPAPTGFPYPASDVG